MQEEKERISRHMHPNKAEREHPGMPAQYRADHIGSLLRPSDLLDARNSGGNAEKLRTLEDQHILRVLAKQKELGFEIFTDGELRRRNFMSDFTDAVEGFDFGDAVARNWSAGDKGAAPVSNVNGIVSKKLRQVRPLTGHELPFTKKHSPGDINDFAERDAISSDLVQARRVRRYLQRSFGAVVG